MNPIDVDAATMSDAAAFIVSLAERFTTWL
jgi:hypothetical protein